MSNVVPIKPKKTEQESQKKWGKKVMSIGFDILPSLLFKAQRRLGLTSSQLVVLLHLANHWWDANNNPWPSVTTIAERMGIQRRQVQKIMKDLETAGLVQRIERRARHRGKLSNEYDLSGLVKKLKEIAPDFIEAEKEAKTIKDNASKPKMMRKKKVKKEDNE